MKLKTKQTQVEIDIGDEGFITVRKLTRGEMLEVVTPYKLLAGEKGTGDDVKAQMESLLESGDTDTILNLSECFIDFFKKMVVSWRGIDDEEGLVLICDIEAVNLICEYDREFVIGFVPIALTQIEAKETAIVKNCKPGASGTLHQAGSLAINAALTEDVNVVLNAPSPTDSTLQTPSQ